MAELLLKVGAGANYSDGDILCAFNKHAIDRVHLGRVCHHWTNTPNADRYQPLNTHTQEYYEQTYQYRFVRLDKWHAERVDIATGTREPVGPAQYGVTIGALSATVEADDQILELRRDFKRDNRLDFDGDRGLWMCSDSVCAVLLTAAQLGQDDVTVMYGPQGQVSLMVGGVSTPYTVQLLTSTSADLPHFFRRRRRQRAPNGGTKAPIFGSVGTEVWYGGRFDLPRQKVNHLWTSIQQHTPLRRTHDEFQKWPMGRLDIRSHLAIESHEFTDAEAEEMVEPLVELDGNGDPIEDAHGRRNVLKMRANFYDWANDVLPGIGNSRAEVEDPATPIGTDHTYRGNAMSRTKQQPAIPLAAMKRRSP